MSALEFCYWLQGFFEIANPDRLTKDQLEMIQRHLSMAFLHDIDKRYPVAERSRLNELHNPNQMIKC